MTRVAVVFDQYRNPNQPFLSEWFLRLRQIKKLRIKGFADRLVGSNSERIVVFKARRLAKINRYFSWRIRLLFRAELKLVPYQYHNLVVFEPEVVHVLNAQQLRAYWEVLAMLKSKLVVSFRGYETSVRPTKDPTWLQELKLIYDRADKLHFVSDFLKNEAIRLGAPPEKCIVIRRSVDTDFFFPKTVESDCIRLLAVGRLTWQKGYDILLKAVSELISEGRQLKLAIIGEGPDRIDLEALVNLLGLGTFVEFQGQVSRERLRDAFWNADIFVQASVSDALPNSILEASACGLPVVSTTAGGIPEAVRNELSGLLVSPNNPPELANALRVLLDDPDLRKNMGINARVMMEELFAPTNEVARWESFYKSFSTRGAIAGAY